MKANNRSRIALRKDLIKRAAGEIFEGYFVGIDFTRAVRWFDEGNKLRLADTASAEECRSLIEADSGTTRDCFDPI